MSDAQSCSFVRCPDRIDPFAFCHDHQRPKEKEEEEEEASVLTVPTSASNLLQEQGKQPRHCCRKQEVDRQAGFAATIKTQCIFIPSESTSCEGHEHVLGCRGSNPREVISWPQRKWWTPVLDQVVHEAFCPRADLCSLLIWRMVKRAATIMVVVSHRNV